MRDINTDYVNNYSTTYADKYNGNYSTTDVSQHVLETYDNYHVYVSLHVLCSISLCLSLSSSVFRFVPLRLCSLCSTIVVNIIGIVH